MPIQTINGTEIFYEADGDGYPLVLVHGSWGDHFNWLQVVPGFAESFQVITYDRRGHGASAKPGDGTRRDDEDDLASLIEALDIAPAHGRVTLSELRRRSAWRAAVPSTSER